MAKWSLRLGIISLTLAVISVFLASGLTAGLTFVSAILAVPALVLQLRN